MKKFVLFFLIIFSNYYADSYTGSFLKMPIGAANISTGNGTILHSSNEILFQNPAALTFLKKNQLSFSHNQFNFDRKSMFASYIFSNKEIKFALSYYQYGISEIEERDHNGELISTFNDISQIYYLTLGGKKNNAYFGVNIKYLHQSIYNQTASSIFFDLAVTYKITHRSLFSYCYKNLDLTGVFDGQLQAKLKWKVDLWNNKTTSFEYPIAQSHHFLFQRNFLKFQSGIGYHIFQDNEKFISLATSYKLNQHFSLKLSLYDSKFIVGLGMKFKIFKDHTLIFNYSSYKEDYFPEYVHFLTFTLGL